jgi:hypothetical protein
MNKRLTITYGDAKLYDEIPEHFNWDEGGGSIRLQAGVPAVNPLTQVMQKALANKGTGTKRVQNGTAAQA